MKIFQTIPLKACIANLAKKTCTNYTRNEVDNNSVEEGYLHYANKVAVRMNGGVFSLL